MSLIIAQAARDRAATGRTIVAVLVGATIISGLLISGLGYVAPPSRAPLKGTDRVTELDRPHDDTSGQSHRHRIVTRIVDGQCLVEGSATGPNGRSSPFTFLLDSGADGLFFTVASHARALGIDPAQLDFDHSYTNWIGTVHGATIRLRELRIGDWSQSNVEAAMDQTGFRQPLLGLPFLKALNFRVVGDSCELSWS
jgi:clan AA aspartic protease (TIGR02281 family)